MIRWNTLVGGNVAEHSFLLVVVAAHSLVSLAFLTSDEFYQLKLQRSGIFQQAAKRTDLSVYSQDKLDKVALLLNQRPRKTLGFQTPADKLQASVALTS